MGIDMIWNKQGNGILNRAEAEANTHINKMATENEEVINSLLGMDNRMLSSSDISQLENNAKN